MIYQLHPTFAFNMFDLKNIAPRQIALINAVAISLAGGLANFLFIRTWWIFIVTFAILFVISYLLTHFFLQSFIYRKIKLIYKFIYQTKATKREEFYYKNILPQKSIDEVSEDVEKWAEQRKQEIEVLQRNEAYRKEFLQNLSHEFKTPVFAIQGYVDTLLQGALDNPEVNKKFLTSASKNVDRLVNLIDDLDEISKLESGEQQLHYSLFVIQDLTREVFESLSIKASDKNIRCLIKKGCETPINVFADKEKIRQVLINLADNAIKYGKNGGMVEASFYNTDGTNILVEISDDGMGISEEHLPRIFERFYRTDYGRSRNIGGTGLGLAICKHIIEAHGHSIHVRSKPDVGTTFGFTLPAKKD
ncbi:MAG: HAMP domain-containing histidine kinase [Chitinophagaceae bacterium]|jgi:two-component system phosphate regulon sensor histidine kinase PhoR|nr:HAMP domain-containing histidine kinase [Chitinophagaceae bacterium]